MFYAFMRSNLMDQSRLNFFWNYNSKKSEERDFFFMFFNREELNYKSEELFFFINDFHIKRKKKSTKFNINLKKIVIDKKSKIVNIITF